MVKSTFSKTNPGCSTSLTLAACLNGRNTLFLPLSFSLWGCSPTPASCTDSWHKESLSGIQEGEGDIHLAIQAKLRLSVVVCILESFKVDQEARVNLKWRMVVCWASSFPFEESVNGCDRKRSVDNTTVVWQFHYAYHHLFSCRTEERSTSSDVYSIIFCYYSRDRCTAFYCLTCWASGNGVDKLTPVTPCQPYLCVETPCLLPRIGVEPLLACGSSNYFEELALDY